MTSSQRTIKRYIIGAYATFLSMVAVCSLLYPQVFDNYEYGISSFGSFSETMVIYYTGFAATIACLIGMVRQLRPFQEALPLRRALWFGIVAMAIIAVTSYSQNGTGFLLHIITAILLTLNQLVITWWIVTRKDARPLDYVLAFLLVITVIVSVLPLVHDLPTVLRLYPLRELVVFICALGLTGRSALRISARHS